MVPELDGEAGWDTRDNMTGNNQVVMCRVINNTIINIGGEYLLDFVLASLRVTLSLRLDDQSLGVSPLELWYRSGRGGP